jgi:hypothetical protein
MKEQSIKMCMSFIACVLILSMLASGGYPSTAMAAQEATKAAGANPERGSKIGIFCSPLSWGEENYRMVEKYVAANGAERFIINTIPDDSDAQTMISIVSNMANDPECGVIIVNEAIPGTIASLKAARRINPDLLLIAVNPGEEPAEISLVADMVSHKSFDEFGKEVANAAVAKGLDVVVFGVTADDLGATKTVSRVGGAQEICDANGIKLVVTTLPSANDGGNRPALEQAAKEDVYNKLNQYGDKVGFFPCASVAFIPQITALVDKGVGYLLCIADPGPFSPSYCDAFSISAPADHILDADWTNKAIAEKVEGLGLTGHFGNWKFSFLSAQMAASIEYAMNWQDGSQSSKNDVKAWEKEFAKVNNIGENDYTCKNFSANGKEYENVILYSGKIMWYGEDLGVE